MAGYRLYCVDGVGKFVTAGYIDADTDKEALAKAREWDGGGLHCEIWDRQRYVGRVAIGPQSITPV